MRKLIYFMHASLDGFVGGPNGEMNWIQINDEIFEYVDTITAKADTAVYGRVTYEMMEAYWPTAADKPNATQHDKNHSVWYKNVEKIVLSTTLSAEGRENTTIIRNQLKEQINAHKNKDGKNILIFGSPRASHALLAAGLIDEFWIFLNPVLIGQGMPLFKNINEITKLTLLETKVFSGGVIALHYGKK